MALENLALYETSDFPIRHEGNVHNGKVRSVYWLTKEDSRRISGRRYQSADLPLGVMIISDRISAFDVVWQGEQGLKGIPGKGAALNAITEHWFFEFFEYGIGENHILDKPHPLVWIVQKAEPVMIEAIARRYITGSMWRDYEKGTRNFCGNVLPEGLKKDQKLSDILYTPSTKGTLIGIPGVPEEEDANITRQQILDNYKAFGFKSIEDALMSEILLRKAFALVSKKLAELGQNFVDTKFEFGYIRDSFGKPVLGFIDEAATPDSSRVYDAIAYNQRKIVESSKEPLRQWLLANTDNDRPASQVHMLLDKKRMEDRRRLAAEFRLPVDVMMNTSEIYKSIAEKITGEKMPKIHNAREEIIDALAKYEIIG